MLTAMRDQTLLEPAGRDRLAALERQVISEWTSARLALSTVIPDWSARIKTSIFAGSERSQQKKLAQEAVALIERREDHLGREGETGPPTVSEDQLHPWVWSAARATWSSGHYRHAVSDAVEAVTTKLKERINFTGPSSAAYTAAFAESSPKAGNPRLHLHPFEEGNTWKNSQRGAAALGQACIADFATPRLPTALTTPSPVRRCSSSLRRSAFSHGGSNPPPSSSTPKSPESAPPHLSVRWPPAPPPAEVQTRWTDIAQGQRRDGVPHLRPSTKPRPRPGLSAARCPRRRARTAPKGQPGQLPRGRLVAGRTGVIADYQHRVDLRLVGIRDHRPQARGPRLRRVVEASCVDDHRTHPTRDHRCHQPIAAPAAHRPRPTPQTIGIQHGRDLGAQGRRPRGDHVCGNHQVRTGITRPLRDDHRPAAPRSRARAVRRGAAHGPSCFHSSCRYNVDRDTPTTSATSDRGVPSSIILRACFAFAGVITVGRPPLRPRARAAARPA